MANAINEFSERFEPLVALRSGVFEELNLWGFSLLAKDLKLDLAVAVLNWLLNIEQWNIDTRYVFMNI